MTAWSELFNCKKFGPGLETAAGVHVAVGTCMGWSLEGFAGHSRSWESSGSGNSSTWSFDAAGFTCPEPSGFANSGFSGHPKTHTITWLGMALRLRWLFVWLVHSSLPRSYMVSLLKRLITKVCRSGCAMFPVMKRSRPFPASTWWITIPGHKSLKLLATSVSVPFHSRTPDFGKISRILVMGLFLFEGNLTTGYAVPGEPWGGEVSIGPAKGGSELSWWISGSSFLTSLLLGFVRERLAAANTGSKPS